MMIQLTLLFILIEMGRLNPNILDIIVSRDNPLIIINPLMINWLNPIIFDYQ